MEIKYLLGKEKTEEIFNAVSKPKTDKKRPNKKSFNNNHISNDLEPKEPQKK